MASTCTLLLLIHFLSSVFGSAQNRNSFTTSNFIRDPETLISSNGFFQLGFFTIADSSSRYLGIWYHNKVDNGTLEVVWVANRDKPLNDTTGVLKISEHGNLQLVNAKNKIFWSSDVSSRSGNGLIAQLQDTGNLVLVGNGSGSEDVIWESFKHPTDTFLPQMKITTDKRSNENRQFRSWMSSSNPSSGKYTVGIRTRNQLTEAYIWSEDDKPHWRSGPYDGYAFIGVPLIYAVLLDGFDLVNDTLSFSLVGQTNLTHVKLSPDGIAISKVWDYSNRKWKTKWTSFKSHCNIYGYCGPFGNCNRRNLPLCSCLKGFEPKNKEEWRKGNWTSGCSRKTSLECISDGFVMLSHMKTPADVSSLSYDRSEDCERRCLGKCDCLAYAVHNGVGCMMWNNSLIDIEELSDYGVDLYIRLANSELVEPSKLKIIIPVLTAAATISSFAVMCFLWRWIRRRNKEKKAASKFKSNMLDPNMSEAELQDLPLFTFEKLVTATNNFHETNKLGRGGFGPVYKGKLEDGQEIAVKRLARRSGQGLQEFMNEVVLISKLQHMNLVRLLGCCVERDEKMLVYEYMPNNSLNVVLFDPLKKENLDWKKRLKIIEGICRGLLYLHRDSRLRIIHRDLKAGNILLDSDLNPKISDFGMARIFGRDEDQANTLRVVGTYGYMSPEYAMSGKFSEKSDVFSFGVLLLEIISGRSIRSFDDEDCLGLLGYAWKLWNEDNILPLIDATISDDSQFEADILRCMQLALLCVQEFPDERPSVSSIISMLHRDIQTLPRPKQPGFTQKRNFLMNEFNQSGQQYHSVNRISITSMSAR